MIRGALVQLSPSEEITLRRIAVGSDRLLDSHVLRFDKLKLIERRRGSWCLTALGRHRYDGLEKPPLFRTTVPLADEISRILDMARRERAASR